MDESIMTVVFKEKTFYFNQTPTAPALLKEIFNDNYRIFANGLQFGAGDTILDIGANEGMFSILMAKMFPEARVVSFEPVPRTFFQMIRNIGLNGVTNIEALCFGVGKDDVGVMNVHNEFSGGSSLVDTFDPANHKKVYVSLMPLDEVVKKYAPIKLLKMDIEGGEHEALAEFQRWNEIENMVAEFHINNRLASEGYEIEALAEHVRDRTNLLYYERCRMAD
jgi:FkbM family methyltransferase